MTGRTHLAAGIGTGALLVLAEQKIASGATVFPIDAAITVAGGALGSLIPDIDTPTSKLGHKIKPLSALFNTLCGHRAMFHSVVVLIIAWGITSWACPPGSIIPISVAIGFASHLLLDALNPLGIPLFWPFEKRVRLAHIKTGSLTERIIYIALVAADIILILSVAGKILAGV